MILLKVPLKYKYSGYFISKVLPNFIKNTFGSFAKSQKYQGIIKALQDEYNVDINEVAGLLNSATHITLLEDDIMLSLNDTSHLGEFPVDQIFRFLEFGNRTHMGAGLISDYQQFLCKNLHNIYKHYKWRKNSKLWR